MVLKGGFALPWLHGGHSHELHGELSSSAFHWDLSFVCRGLPGWLGFTGLSVCWLLGSVWLGLVLSSGVGLDCGESFSPSRADFFSKMKLKASFSAMSHFAVLALTQSSKVLKEVHWLFVSSMVLKETLLVPLLSMVLKGTCLVPLLSMVLNEMLLVPFLPMVLKEGALLTSCSVSWKETFFLPDLPRSWKNSLCLYFWLCHWLYWHYPFLW